MVHACLELLGFFCEICCRRCWSSLLVRFVHTNFDHVAHFQIPFGRQLLISLLLMFLSALGRNCSDLVIIKLGRWS